jgi:hypothetical protein
MAKKKKVETEDARFERISHRVVIAFEELNAALEEAHGCKSMTVGLKMSSAVKIDEMLPWKPEAPTRFLYHIGRIVKCSLELSLQTQDMKVWKEAKKSFLFSPTERNPHE